MILLRAGSAQNVGTTERSRQTLQVGVPGGTPYLPPSWRATLYKLGIYAQRVLVSWLMMVDNCQQRQLNC